MYTLAVICLHTARSIASLPALHVRNKNNSYACYCTCIGMSSEWSADQLEDVAANNAERIPSGSGESPVPSPELVSPGEDVPEPQVSLAIT